MYAIIVYGAPAAGKTTLGKFIAGSLRIPFFYKDGIKESLFDTLGYSDAAWSKKLGIASMELLFQILENNLESKTPCVIEANFKAANDKDHLRSIIESHDARCIEIFCHAPASVLAQRFAERIARKERHPGHHTLP